jgi:uncharacterized protein YkwD
MEEKKGNKLDRQMVKRGLIFGFCLFVLLVVSRMDLLAEGSWDRAVLNTAAGVTYLTDNEKAVILEINKLRSDPAAYAREYLEPLLNLYDGKKLNYPGDVPIITKEGVVALKDAIRELKSAPPVPLLSPDLRLTKASRDHMKDQSATGRTGHTGSDGSSAQDRIRRYGPWQKAMGENIFYGDPDARAVVLHLVIDDGIPKRGHRKNFLSEHYLLVGVACGKHPGWRNVCVMDFAHSFKP